jgi:3-oxoadipate enol-lactonase
MELTNPRTGIRMWYDVRGTGEPPIVFIHGWTGNRTRWGTVPEVFSKSNRTAVYDLRGHGHSDKGPELEYGFSAHVLDLLGMLDALGFEKPVLAGHSMGGMIVQSFALAFPERVSKIILHATAARIAASASDRKKYFAIGWLFQHAFGLAMRIKDADKRKDPAVRRMFPDIDDPSLRISPAATARCLHAIAHLDLRPRLCEIKIPALVIASETDDTIDFALTKEMTELIPGAVFKVTTGCGHHIALDQPDFAISAIREFI